MKNIITSSLAAAALLLSVNASSAEYEIDTKGAHAFIQFKIAHLGYSWLYGRFNTFSGNFTYDESKPEKARVTVDIDPASVDTNHAERDKHLRGEDFFDVKKFPKSSFRSTSYKATDKESGVLTGDFTLHGVTKEIKIDVKHIGAGKDPWGGFRRGFEGKTTIALKDYGIDYNLGPASETVELTLSVEGIRKD